MKKLFIYFVILAVNALFIIARCGPTVPMRGGSGSEVWGMVIDTNGTAVSGAGVVLAKFKDSSLVDTIGETVTNSKGEYSFMDITSGTYLVQGELVDKNLIFLHSDVYYDSGKIYLGTDTMRAPGAIVCIFDGVKEDEISGAVGFITRTPYFGIADRDTLKITSIYPGLYTLKCALQPFGYLPIVIDTIKIISDRTTVVKVNVVRDTTGEPPSPENLEMISYDTLNGVALIKWSPVSVLDIDGYYVYSGLDPINVVKSSTIIKDTLLLLNVAVDSTGGSVTTYVKVKAVDTRGNESSFSNIYTIVAPSPKLVKTSLSDTLIKPNDVLYSGDTVTIIANFSNATRGIDSVVWALGRSDSIVKYSYYNDSLSGSDSLQIFWGEQSELFVYISVFDNSGNVLRSQKKITGSGLYPPDTWKVFPVELPTPRQYLTAVAINNRIVTLGGEGSYYDLTVGVDRLKVFGVIESFSPDSFAPFTTGLMTSALSEHASVVYDNKIYSIGGNTSKKDSVSTIEVFDPVSGVSSSIMTLPEKITGASLCISGSKLVVIGGKRTIGGVSEGVISGSVDVIDLSMPKNPAPSHIGNLLAPRSNHCAVVCNEKIYVLGGIDSTRSGTLSSFEIVDIQAGTFINGGNMLSPRCKFSAASINGKIIIFGGYISKNLAIKDVEVLETTSISGMWQKGSDMSSARYGTSAVVYNNKVYVIGGATVGTDGSTIFSSDIEIYYP